MKTVQKRILVTGGAGFLGSHLCERLSARGHDILCADNSYGPRMHPNDGRVVSNFIVQALKNEPITLDGDGSQTRAFCYVDDLVEGFLRMMGAPDSVIGPMNLGNPVETSVA